MKKSKNKGDFMRHLIMFLIIALLCSGCTNINSATPIAEPIANHSNHTFDINLSVALDRLSEPEQLATLPHYINYISVKPLYLSNATALTVGTDTIRQLFFIEVNENGEKVLVETAHGGLARFFEPREVKLSQGVFVEILSVGNMAQGNLVLLSPKSPYDAVYSINNVVDEYYQCNLYEEITLPENINIEAIENIETARFSTIYDGGKLNVSYEDVNSDGNTDIVLRGIIKYVIHLDENDIFDISTLSERSIRLVYLYNETEDSFDLCNELSQK